MRVKLLITAVFILGIISFGVYYFGNRYLGQTLGLETTSEKHEEGVSHPEYEEPEPEGETHVVEIKNSSFVPSEIKIEHGSIMAFINKDSEVHTVTSDTAGTDKPGSFDLGELDTGVQLSAARYDVKGEYTYHCKIHPEMKGKIIVH